ANRLRARSADEAIRVAERDRSLLKRWARVPISPPMHRSRSLARLVQEDRDARFASAQWLTHAGYRCLLTEDAAAGFRSVRYVTPHVAVVDGNLAGSADLIHYLEDQHDKPAIVVVSTATAHRRRELCAGEA